MAFQLVVTIPPAADDGAGSPAFWVVCANALLSRIAVGAFRKGAQQIVVVGDELERARELLSGDSRLEGADLVFGEVPDSALPRVEATADVVVGLTVWSALDEAEGPVTVPGAPHLVRLGDGEPRPLWTADAVPYGAYATPVRARSDLKRAKQVIFDNITKSTSGPVSRHLNARMSIPLSKLLVETPMTPNQMTATNTVVGILGSLCFATGQLFWVMIGGLVLQLASALDRNDGELARAKMMESLKGAWYDSVGDNITYVALIICIVAGYVRFSAGTDVPWAPYAALIGWGTIALTVAVIGGQFAYVHIRKLGGTMTAISHTFRAEVDTKKSTLIYRLLDKVKVLGERDQFSLILMVAAGLPWLTGNPGFYHGMFLVVVGFVLLANIYFGYGALKTLKRAS